MRFLGATPELIQKGILTEYFELISPHDDRKVRNTIAKANRLEKKEGILQHSQKSTLRLQNNAEVSGYLADAVCSALV